MSIRQLSPSENEIISLSARGLSNESIAEHLGVSEGIVNTHWLRIKLSSGGEPQTEALKRAIEVGADQALRDANVERKELANFIAEKEKGALDLRAPVALLRLTVDQIRSSVWATAPDLSIYVIVDGEFPWKHCGIRWDVDKTVYQVFKTKDPFHPAIAAHLDALDGHTSLVHLEGAFAKMTLKVSPLLDENGEVIGCISALYCIGE